MPGSSDQFSFGKKTGQFKIQGSLVHNVSKSCKIFHVHLVPTLCNRVFVFLGHIDCLILWCYSGLSEGFCNDPPKEGGVVVRREGEVCVGGREGVA